MRVGNESQLERMVVIFERTQKMVSFLMFLLDYGGRVESFAIFFYCSSDKYFSTLCEIFDNL